MEKSAFSANDQSKGTPMTTYGTAPGANAAPEKGDRISEATKVLKALMRSWIMLALAVTCTVTTIFTVVDIIPDLKGLMIAVNFVKLLLAVVACVGVWKIFFAGRAQNTGASGFKLVNGALSVRYTVIILIVALIYVIVFLSFGVISELSGSVDSAVGGDGELELGVNNILIIVLVVVTLGFAVIIMFCKSVLGSLKSATKLLEQRVIVKNNYFVAAVILLIIGLVKFLSAVMSGFVGTVLNELVDKLGGEVSMLSFFSDFLPSSGSAGNWSGIVLDVCDMLNYILGGIIIVLYAVRVRKFENPELYRGA